MGNRQNTSAEAKRAAFSMISTPTDIPQDQADAEDIELEYHVGSGMSDSVTA